MIAIAKKEFIDSVSSLKFWLIFGIFALLIFGSAYTGLQKHKEEMEEFQKQSQKTQERLFGIKVPKPTLYSSFTSMINSIATVGALLGIMIGYNLIEGEKRRGTLKVLLSYPTYRDSVLNAKFLGGLFTLIITSFVVISIAVGGMIFFDLEPSGEEIVRLSLFLLSSMVYITFFLTIGMFFSILLREDSLFASVIFWIFSVMISRLAIRLIVDAIPGGSQNLFFALIKFSPTDVYQQFAGLMLSPYKPSYAQLGPMPEPATLAQSLAFAWSNLTILIGLSIVTFVASYIIFIRQDIR